MRAVVDTNVIMSAVFFGGVPFDVLNAWHSGEFELVVSKAVMSEYREIAERMKARFPSVDPEMWLLYIEDHATMIYAEPLAVQVCEDVDDDVFLACAAASNAKVVCSGDRHLLACSGWNGIDVLTPRLFYNLLKSMQ